MSIAPSQSDNRVGITLVTGLLGSGKSTLIRRILTENHNLRIVVVENEFAEDSSVEQAIVTQGLGLAAIEDFIELPNGCICCAAQDDLTDALQRLVDSKRGSFDHILVEASGLADPGPVAASFWVDEGLDSLLYLDAVVTIVDAVNVRYWLNGSEDAAVAELTRKQLALADLVLLNKVDLIQGRDSELVDIRTPQEQPSGALESDQTRSVHGVMEMLRNQGCSAEIIPTTRCDVELSQLLNVHAYDEPSAIETLEKVSRSSEELTHAAHNLVSPVSSVTLTFDGDVFDAEKLDYMFGSILWQQEENENDGLRNSDLWRMKGCAVISGEKCKRLYQSVHTLFDHSSSSIQVKDSDRTSKFVFIGRNLSSSALREVLLKARIA